MSLDKCVLFRTGVTYLGHFISERDISPDPTKLQSLKDYPQPTTLAELWKFIGAVNWFRSFVPHLSTHSHHLQNCIKHSTSDHLAWTPECSEAFSKLKDLLCELTDQSIFDPNLPTYLWTDASDFGL